MDYRSEGSVGYFLAATHVYRKKSWIFLSPKVENRNVQLATSQKLLEKLVILRPCSKSRAAHDAKFCYSVCFRHLITVRYHQKKFSMNFYDLCDEVT